MRLHQKQGVRFMLECICGLRQSNIQGCILADSMGLGKTIQTIALIWTLLRQNPFSMKRVFLQKVIIVTPVSLLKNWEKEINKWLGRTRLIPLMAIGTREQISKTIQYFKAGSYRCLIISYESFRNLIKELNDDSIDLVVFDEGHRLKNQKVKTFQAFNSIQCKRRIILTGTPLQNSLDELYACLTFVNPSIFSSHQVFKQVFADVIVKGMKTNASLSVKQLALDRSKELSGIVSKMVLRRTAEILQKILPPKKEYFIFVGMTAIQSKLYERVLSHRSSSTSSMAGILDHDTMSVISCLRKLLNHPLLVYQDDTVIAKSVKQHFPDDFDKFDWEMSNKLMFIRDLLSKTLDAEEPVNSDIEINPIVELECEKMQQKTNSNSKVSIDKLIIVSYFTQTLDLLELFLKSYNVNFLRLDGQVPALKRQELVDQFNNRKNGIPVFLLCAKAGGTGLNLIGANRMVLMDIDWNPSNDLQVMARIWRDGQLKPCHIYRLIGLGTLEECILQRQLHKEVLSGNVVDERHDEVRIDAEHYKKLFKHIKLENVKCTTFKPEENQVAEFVSEGVDFIANMASYVHFVRIKQDDDVHVDQNQNQNIVKSQELESAENMFSKENVFMNRESEAKQEDNQKSEEDSGEAYLDSDIELNQNEEIANNPEENNDAYNVRDAFLLKKKSIEQLASKAMNDIIKQVSHFEDSLKQQKQNINSSQIQFCQQSEKSYTKKRLISINEQEKFNNCSQQSQQQKEQYINLDSEQKNNIQITLPNNKCDYRTNILKKIKFLNYNNQ